jgi:toxin ParE1/3/4
MKPLRLHDEVESDMEEIWDRIALDDPTMADRFVDAVEKSFAQIGRHPGIGHRRRWRSRQLADVRVWRVDGFRNHLIFYREQDACVAIIAVLSGQRSLERILIKR